MIDPASLTPASPEPIVAAIPSHLAPPEGISDEARAIWITTLSAIAHTGVITTVDLEALRAFCESAALYHKATELLVRSGPLIKGARGDVVRNPAAMVAKQAGEAMRSWARELGLTPASRVGMESNLAQGEHASANAKLEAIMSAAAVATGTSGKRAKPPVN